MRDGGIGKILQASTTVDKLAVGANKGEQDGII
jgi:hypothetical protein